MLHTIGTILRNGTVDNERDWYKEIGGIWTMDMLENTPLKVMRQINKEKENYDN